MNLANKRKLLSIGWLKLVWLVAILALSWGAHSGMAVAAIPANPPPVGHSMPEPADFTQGNNVYLVVAECDVVPACTGAYQLHAPNSTTRIYIKQTAFNNNNGLDFTITDGKGGCTAANNEDDISATNNTNFTLAALKYGSNNAQDPWNGGAAAVQMSGSFTLKSNSLPCIGKTVHVNKGVVTAANLGTGQFAGYYAFQLTATLTSGAGWNSFSLFSAHAQMSYYSSGDDKFGVKAAPGIASNRTPDPGNFALPFAPNCSLSSTKNYTIRWYDADAGRPNQGNQPYIQTYLYGWDQHSGRTSTTQLKIFPNASSSTGATSNPIKNTAADGYQYGGGGNNVGGHFLLHNLKPGWVYSWQWNNIYVANGVQFDLPFDSFYSTNQSSYDCSLPQPPTFKCNATNINNPEPTNTSQANMYTVDVSAYSNTQSPTPTSNYTVTLTPSGGANGGGSLPLNNVPDYPGGNAANPGYTYPQSPHLHFGGYFLYTGSYHVTVKDSSSGAVVATCGGSDTPSTRPFFQVWGNSGPTAGPGVGDISAGGGYGIPTNDPDISDIGACGGSGNPQYISPAHGPFMGNASAGGIRGYSDVGISALKGSSADFGVFSMGQIDSTNFSYMGLQSFDTTPDYLNTGYWWRRPVFSNDQTNIPAAYGGYYKASPPVGCIKDYFNDTRANPQPNNSSTINLNSLISSNYCVTHDPCQYSFPNTITINGTNTVSAGQRATFYVKGDVNIRSNIRYIGNYDATNRKNIPYLTIIARGNINVFPNVNQIDGLYIAQPVGNAKGIFLSCPKPPNWAVGCANNQLVVNGAVIAQKLDLLRAHGTLNGGSVVKYQPAEIFNFTPSMVIGEPAFAQRPSGSTYSAAPIF